MIGFELWDTTGSGLRQNAESWIESAVSGVLSTTDGAAHAAGIEAASWPQGAMLEIHYTPEEWHRHARRFEAGKSRELIMSLRGRGWYVEVTAQLHGTPGSKSPATHLAVLLNRESPDPYGEPLLDRSDLLSQGALLGATGGRIGPAQAGLTRWEESTGRHPYNFWPVADRRIRGPDVALLLGPGHLQLLGGLEAVREHCPAEHVELIADTDLVLVQLARSAASDSHLEQKISQLGEYLSPLLDW